MTPSTSSEALTSSALAAASAAALTAMDAVNIAESLPLELMAVGAGAAFIGALFTELQMSRGGDPVSKGLSIILAMGWGAILAPFFGNYIAMDYPVAVQQLGLLLITGVFGLNCGLFGALIWRLLYETIDALRRAVPGSVARAVERTIDRINDDEKKP